MIARPEHHLIKRALLWIALVALAVTCECSFLFWIATRTGQPIVTMPPAVNWGVMAGRYAFAIPHEAGGRYPYQPWFELFDRDSLFGFGLRIRSSGLSHTYMRVTMVAVPCWFVALVSGLLVVACAKQLGMAIFRAHRGRGFDPVMPGDNATQPAPDARTEESASSAPRN